jgi:hypothetical protein
MFAIAKSSANANRQRLRYTVRMAKIFVGIALLMVITIRATATEDFCAEPQLRVLRKIHGVMPRSESTWEICNDGRARLTESRSFSSTSRHRVMHLSPAQQKELERILADPALLQLQPHYADPTVHDGFYVELVLRTPTQNVKTTLRNTRVEALQALSDFLEQLDVKK